MRILRKFLLISLSLLGSGLMLYGATGDVTLGYPVLLVAIGLTIVLMSVLRWYDPLLPEERHYLLLRAEVNHFLDLVRQLNTAAHVMRELPTPGHRQSAEEVKHEMHNSVEQMALVAGLSYNVLSPIPSHESQQPCAEEAKTASMNST